MYAAQSALTCLAGSWFFWNMCTLLPNYINTTSQETNYDNNLLLEINVD